MTTMRPRVRRPFPSAMLAAAVMTLAACGGGGDDDAADVASLGTGEEPVTTDPQSTAPKDPEEAMLAFTECMREHGVEMSDPEVAKGGGGGVIQRLEGADPDSDGFAAAQEACEPLMEDAVGDIELDPEQEAEMREQLLAYAECMRDHGVDMPDPVFDQGGRVEIGPGDEVGGDMSSDEFEAANEACRDEDGPDFAIAEEARP